MGTSRVLSTLAILVWLFFVYPVHAQSVHMVSGDVINLEQQYTVSINIDGSRILLHNSNDQFIIRRQACTLIQSHRVCFSDAQQIDEIWIATVSIVREKGYGIVTKRVDGNDVIIGKEVSVEFELLNNGTAPFENIKLQDGIPRGASDIMVQSPCTRSQDLVIWEGSLTPSSSIVCRYRFIPTMPYTIESSSWATYYRDGHIMHIYSPRVSMSAHAPVQINSTIDKPHITIHNESASLIIHVTNKGSQDAQISLTIQIPDDLEVETMSRGLEHTPNGIIWSDIITKNTTQSKNITVTGANTGIQLIHIDGSYTTNTNNPLDPHIHFIEITQTDGPQKLFGPDKLPSMDINITKGPLDIGETISIEALIYNRNTQHSIDDITMYIEKGSDILQDIWHGSVPPYRGVRIGPIEIKPQRSGEYVFGVRGIIAFNGTELELYNTSSVIVTGGSPLQLVTTLSQSSMTKGQLITREVHIKNTANSMIHNVWVYDAIPESLVLFSGISNRSISIPPREQVTAYTYEFYAPRHIEHQQKDITTTLQYVHDGINQTIQDISAINIQEGKHAVEINISVPRTRVWKGEILLATISVSNPSEFIVNDVQVDFIPDVSYGIENKDIYVRSLRPLESFQENIRFHFIQQGNTTIQPLRLNYISNGIQYTTTSNAISVAVDDNRSIGIAFLGELHTQFDESTSNYTYTLKLSNNATGNIQGSWSNKVFNISSYQRFEHSITSQYPLGLDTIQYSFSQREFTRLLVVKPLEVITAPIETPPLHQEQEQAVIVDEIDHQDNNTFNVWWILAIVLVGIVGVSVIVATRKKEKKVDKQYITPFDDEHGIVGVHSVQGHNQTNQKDTTKSFTSITDEQVGKLERP